MRLPTQGLSDLDDRGAIRPLEHLDQGVLLAGASRAARLWKLAWARILRGGDRPLPGRCADDQTFAVTRRIGIGSKTERFEGGIGDDQSSLRSPLLMNA